MPRIGNAVRHVWTRLVRGTLAHGKHRMSRIAISGDLGRRVTHLLLAEDPNQESKLVHFAR